MRRRSILCGVNGLLSATAIVWLTMVSAASTQPVLVPIATPTGSPIPATSTTMPISTGSSSGTTTPNPTPNAPTVPTSSSVTIPPPPTPENSLPPTPTTNPAVSPTTPSFALSPLPFSPPSAPTKVVTPPPPPPPSSTKKSTESPNNPLVSPEDIDKILANRMTQEQWALMYSPLDCLDTSLECVQKLQNDAVQNSTSIKKLEAKIQEINTKIEEAKTNNKKLIDLSVFEPGLAALLKKETITENGQSRTIGFFERMGRLFTNPGSVLDDLLVAVGVPILKSHYGGTDANQTKSIAITELAVKVAEMERGKAEVISKAKEKIQQLVLDFDTAAREFQAEQSIVRSEIKSFKIYAITYAAGDGDTNTYLNRKEQLERAKLKVFKDWAKLRAQIANLKNLVIAKE